MLRKGKGKKKEKQINEYGIVTLYIVTEIQSPQSTATPVMTNEDAPRVSLIPYSKGNIILSHKFLVINFSAPPKFVAICKLPHTSDSTCDRYTVWSSSFDVP